MQLWKLSQLDPWLMMLTQFKLVKPPSSGSWESQSHSYSPVRQLNSNFEDLGAAYGTAKSGVGITSMGVLKPELIFKSIVPVIMAGILGIYGLIISLLVF